MRLKRGQAEMHLDVLLALTRKDMSVTGLMRETNISWYPVRVILENLKERGLAKEKTKPVSADNQYRQKIAKSGLDRRTWSTTIWSITKDGLRVSKYLHGSLSAIGLLEKEKERKPKNLPPISVED